ncbi:MAG: hypothetical protein NTX25_02630 [Proteobacteria bacterium]|nr:hypothetical protein [Pseudomonadota bacterium]
MTRIQVEPLLLLAFVLVGCDYYHKDKCEWYLVPEPDHINMVEEGWVSLCARNYVINKERCYLKSTIEFAKEVNGKKFRLSSLKSNEQGPFPREVLSIKACKGD